jgi:hypothetical protein
MSSTLPHQIAARLEQSLDVQVTALRKDISRITIVGMILLVVLLSYFHYVAGIWHREIRPKELAVVTGAYLSDFIVGGLKDYSATLIHLAPDHAAGLIDHTLLQATSLSKDIRYMVIGWLEEQLSEIERLVVALVDTSYVQHSPDLKLLLRDIKTPGGKKAFEEYFSTLLSGPLASESVRIDIESLDMTLDTLQERLTRLTKGEGLNPQETVERDIMVAFREFWERNAK